MQNPFRHRPSDDFARRDNDDTRWEARDQRYEEGRSWSEGDGGRTYQAYGDQGRSRSDQDRYQSSPRDQSYGQGRQADYGRSGSTPYAGDRGSSYDSYGSRSSYGRDASYGQDRWSGQDQNRGYYSRDRGGYDQNRNDYGQSDYGHSNIPPYASQGYAPGSEIWRGSGRDVADNRQSRHDFEPDYLHWRDQQLSNFDRDYSDWRSERRQKFSSDFDSWRRSRPEVKGENPIVGDVADGGTGDAREAKKS